MRAFFMALVTAVGLAAAIPAAHAAKAEIYTGWFSNVAVDGHDVVALFTERAVEKGSVQFETTHKGAEWRFVSQENLDRFLADPDAFVPEYGGYCAWAMAQGYLAKGNPNFATKRDGKLYLNYDAKVQETWETDIPGFIEKADANWPGILNE